MSRNAPVAVVLEDPSPMAAEVVAGLELIHLHLAGRSSVRCRMAERLMLARRVDAIVRIPNDFSRRLAAGDAQVQLLVHGTEASRAIIIRSYVNGALRLSGRKATRRIARQSWDHQAPARSRDRRATVVQLPPITAPGTWCRG